MKLLASKFNEKKFFLRSQLYARAYVRIWTVRPWPGYTNRLCGSAVVGSDVKLGTRRSDQKAILAGRSLFV